MSVGSEQRVLPPHRHEGQALHRTLPREPAPTIATEILCCATGALRSGEAMEPVPAASACCKRALRTSRAGNTVCVVARLAVLAGRLAARPGGAVPRSPYTLHSALLLGFSQRRKLLRCLIEEQPALRSAKRHACLLWQAACTPLTNAHSSTNTSAPSPRVSLDSCALAPRPFRLGASGSCCPRTWLGAAKRWARHGICSSAGQDAQRRPQHLAPPEG